MTYFNYFTEIEETFVRRRNKHLLISPMDWALIDSWKDRGVPLHIVIRSINSVFDVYDKQPPGTRPIGSLNYCKSEVEAQYREWLTSQTGKSEDGDGSSSQPAFTIPAIEQHIDAAVEKLGAINRPEIAEDLAQAIARLGELRPTLTDNFEAVDAALNAIEKDLEAAMLTSWKREEFESIEKAVAGTLASYKADMKPEDYQRTLTLTLLKRLREESGIPRLGLFYL